MAVSKTARSIPKTPKPKVAASASQAPKPKVAASPPKAPTSEGDPLLGRKAPSFRLNSGRGELIASSSLAGAPYVLYFYPKDNTPGCTQEACDFRDSQRSFERLGARVFGVSPDSPESHEKFAKAQSLKFDLLSDPDHELAEKYGVWGLKKNYGREYYGIVRSTFVIDKNGKVQAAFRGVRVAGHVERVLEELGAK